MTPHKANGDPLEGAYVGPQSVDPFSQNVNCHPMGWAYGEGNPAFDFAAPSVPASPGSPSHTATSVALTWQASTDALVVDHYNIYNGSTLLGATSNTSATVSGLTTGTAYHFAVSAVDERGNESAKSATVTVTPS
jgi:hypothetical protein